MVKDTWKKLPKRMTDRLHELQNMDLSAQNHFPWKSESKQTDLEKSMQMCKRFYGVSDHQIEHEIKSYEKDIERAIHEQKHKKKLIKILKGYLKDEFRLKIVNKRQEASNLHWEKRQLENQCTWCDVCKVYGHVWKDCPQHVHSPNYMSDCSTCANMGMD
jgi:hypothetical protein